MKIEHHYNLLTELTPCINNIIELAVLQKGHHLSGAAKPGPSLLPSKQRPYGQNGIKFQTFVKKLTFI